MENIILRACSIQPTKNENLYPINIPYQHFNEKIDVRPHSSPKVVKRMIQPTERENSNVVDDHVVNHTNVVESLSSQKKKRQKTATSPKSISQISHDLSLSISYTKKLERLLCGNESINLLVGSTFLSTTLKDAPPLITETNRDNNMSDGFSK